MKGFSRQGFFSLFVILLGVLFDSVSRCDARSRVVAGANPVKALHACDDHIMHISCPHRSLSVKILSAKYGRQLSVTNICSPTSERQIIKDCGQNNVKPNVVKLCAGKTECSFNVDDRNLGAFCVNVYKYLTVFFMCAVKPTTKEPPTTTPMPTTTPLPTTAPITTTSPPTVITTTLKTFIQIQPNTNLTSTNITRNSTNNDSSIEPIEPIEATQKAIKVSAPRTRKPVIEVYERDVFSRRSGAAPALSSGLHSICKFAVSLLVFVAFDAYIFRVT